MSETKGSKGRLTIPTDLDIVPETLELMERWGADALRDADGTEFPAALRDTGAKVYATYYTTRKDNAWASANPEEIQQCYIMTGFHSTAEGPLRIPLMQGISPELLQLNTHDDPARWWEVIDRTTGGVVPPAGWHVDGENGCVVVPNPEPGHVYTASFLAYIIWDPVHMYNAVVNGWSGEHQITFDVRQPKSKAFTLCRLREYLEAHPYVGVVRFTTFFHQFTLLFDEQRREKYVDWYGYSASVSPCILEQFEQEVGYPFRPEYIIDQGYYNNQYRVPSPQFQDFMSFQRREVASLARELVGIVHEYGREAMMFLGDHWIGTEPFMPEFATIGLDAVVGSVGNGSTLRLISDIPGVAYTEGRLLPYFFPDTFHEGGNPVAEAKSNWVTARRALLRSPVDRIGYGGYLKLACQFPDFIGYVGKVADEFRYLYGNVQGMQPFCIKRVAVLNAWGKMRSWGCHMVHHALYQKQNYSYAGVVEILSGAPYEVVFLSFDEVMSGAPVLDGVDVVIMAGDRDTAHTGGEKWEDPALAAALRHYVARGGGIIGVGEPTAHQRQGRLFQLADVLGVEMETGLTLGYDKYNWEQQAHFITQDVAGYGFGEGKKGVYALEGTQVLVETGGDVQLAANQFGKGRAVYASGLPYSAENARLLHRMVLWAAGAEAEAKTWVTGNVHVEVHAYTKNKRFCVVNNTEEPQRATIWQQQGKSSEVQLEGGEIRWMDME